MVIFLVSRFDLLSTEAYAGLHEQMVEYRSREGEM